MKIEEVDGEELVKKFAEEMEEMLGRKMKSVKVIMAVMGNLDLDHLPVLAECVLTCCFCFLIMI